MTDSPTRHPASDADAAPDWEALARYLAGESPEGEARALAAWLAAHPEDAAMLRALDDAVARVAVPELSDAPIDVEGALLRVRRRLDQAPAAEAGHDVRPLRPPAARRRLVDWRLAGLAAAAVAAIAVGIGRRGATGDGTAPTASPATELRTAVGVRDSLRLPDGSRVVLAPGSRLSVAAGYGGDAREVRLEGEGWFAVRHDEARPFRVLAGGARVVDLGTEFTVRTDGLPGARGVAVAVYEGSVSIAPDTDATGAATAVVLGVGDRATLDARGRVSTERGAVTAEDAAWTRGRLTYRGTPLVVVRADLRRWYGVDLRIADSALVGRRLTAAFDGDPVDRVLEVIALAVGGEIARTGDVVVLRRARGSR